MWKLASITLSIIVLACSSFYAGTYVGNIQGVFYSNGLQAHEMYSRLAPLNSKEAYEGERSDSYNHRLTENIEWYGVHLESVYYKFPSPLNLTESGTSFMDTAIRYRVENPHVNKAPALSSEEESELDNIYDKEFPVSEEFVREMEAYREERNNYYKRAIDHVKNP